MARPNLRTRTIEKPLRQLWPHERLCLWRGNDEGWRRLTYLEVHARGRVGRYRRRWRRHDRAERRQRPVDRWRQHNWGVDQCAGVRLDFVS
jgi:hypothetical protein